MSNGESVTKRHKFIPGFTKYSKNSVPQPPSPGLLDLSRPPPPNPPKPETQYNAFLDTHSAQFPGLGSEIVPRRIYLPNGAENIYEMDAARPRSTGNSQSNTVRMLHPPPAVWPGDQSPVGSGQLRPVGYQDSTGSALPSPLIYPASDEPAESTAPNGLSNSLEPECFDCGASNLTIMMCSVCRVEYCDGCWDEAPLHIRRTGRRRNTGIREQPHERVDPKVEAKLNRILEPQTKRADLEALLIQDEDTTWFAAFKDQRSDYIFQDLGRYGRVVSGLNKNAYPALVSFVGPTGSGKSTVIKLLMELNYPNHLTETPVVKSTACFDATPTSGDVHLFCDPHTCLPNNTRPIFYVDCEGLEGGEREPLGARSRTRERIHKTLTAVGAKSSQPKPPRNRATQQSSDRELKWATTEMTRRREYIVAELYPRILYTFSDTVVFVLREVNKVESVIERLLLWAEAALEKASNQPILPYAIIVMNSLPNDTAEPFWNTDIATKSVLGEVNSGFLQNPKFKRFISRWNSLGAKVRNVEDLLKCHYDHVRIVRIPRKGRSNLIKDQVSLLYEEIKKGVQHAHKMKRRRRMLVNAVTLQTHLQSAYDHFADSLDTPFDFVKSTFAHSPIPSDFGGNILKLILEVKRCNIDKQDGKWILQQVAPMVASCILLDATREKIVGDAAVIFPEYKPSCENAFKDFTDKHWECEYTDFRNPRAPRRCVNYRLGHKTKGHQDSNGKILATGEYVTSLNSEYLQTFLDLITGELESNELKLAEHTGGRPENELKSAASVHSNEYMAPFYAHAGGAREFSSNSACLVCLFYSPEHYLRCGHVICTPCLQTYGSTHSGYVSISKCPMHPQDEQFKPPLEFALKPPSAGVRVLSLDGGGVRGLSQLIFLRHLEQALGPGLQLTSFFDLIVGTSTGAHIGLGLGIKNWTIEECIRQFKILCHGAYSSRSKSSMLGLHKLTNIITHRYKPKPLQRALMSAFSEADYLFGGTAVSARHVPKVAVTTASSAGKTIVLGNYNHVDNGESAYEFPRPEKPEDGFKTWEAARATCATPGYIQAFSHVASKEDYLDGGIYHNNPIYIAESESKLIWPEVEHLPPDLVLSLGSGYNPSPSLGKEKTFQSWNPLVRATERLHWMATDHIQSSSSSEATWEKWLKYREDTRLTVLPASTQSTQNRYIRWSVRFECKDDPPKLDDLGSLPRIEAEAEKQAQNLSPQIRRLADRLICSSFFFVLRQTIKLYDTIDGGVHFQGSISCRLGHRQHAAALGRFFLDLNKKRGLRPSWKPHFTIREISSKPQDIPGPENTPVAPALKVPLSRIINKMTNRYNPRFESQDIKFTASSEDAIIEISLCLDESSQYPISGFPNQILMNAPDGIIPENNFFRRGRGRTPTRADAPGSTRTSDEFSGDSNWGQNDTAELASVSVAELP
ncbi:hypothetical protein TWF730_001585 [Orbilia blumenaviensis]|uniref:FabD/lysophospholipase-like protein n=1 Tax=Orbilia blumenaviensis TaxID=1796055 RepID=A0AAV9UJ20_9PEZI